MKKYIAFLLCLIMILSLISCNFNDDKDNLSSNENGGVSDVNDGNTNDDNINLSISEAEKAMQMYEAAIKGEVCIIDEHLGEIKLKACRFPSDNLRLDECEILSKAIFDIDGDGINEYVIQSPKRDHIILRYYHGKIYSYCFDSKSLFRLNTDGTFYWYSTEKNLTIIGMNQITFNGSSITIKELYRLKNVWEYAEEYYLDGCLVTREEYLDYYNYNHKTWAQFTPFELSCQYPITAEKAWNIADDYLGNIDERQDHAAGATIVYKVIITDKPSDDSEYYIVVLQEFHYCHGIDGWEISNPAPLYEHNRLVVNAITGECREYVDSVPDGK